MPAEQESFSSRFLFSILYFHLIFPNFIILIIIVIVISRQGAFANDE